MSTSFQRVVDHLPEELKTQAQSLPQATIDLFDTVLRFSLGLGCPEDRVSHATQQQWAEKQQRLLTDQRGSTAEKRARDDVADQQDAEEPSAKKAKVVEHEADDEHVFTLNALSASAPLRKKVDLAIHQRSLRLLNPTTHASESSVSLQEITRAFLLPTRGKSKPHWTVVLLSCDSPTATTGRNKAKLLNGSSDQSQVQVVFGVDAKPTTAYSTSDASYVKGTPILPSLRTFLSHLPSHIAVSDLSLEEDTKVKGIQAYRRAKEGTLWFLHGGVLWDGKPCEFWDVADLVGSDPGEDSGTGTGTDGVRIVSATGRTCSVFLRRQVASSPAGTDDMEEDDDQAGEVEVEETDFGMIDGKEQDAILQWVKRHRRRFGQLQETQPEANGANAEGSSMGKIDVKGKGRAIALPDEDSDDEEDEDFVDDESDGGSPSVSSDSEGEDGGEGAQGSGGEDDAVGDLADEGDDDEDEDEELDPARHPLMRPGAMPKMSRAAIEAAVGMVTGNLLGGGDAASADEDEEDEEDELED